MDTLTDENSLIAQSLAGKPEAFGRIVARYQSQVCSVAYSATGDVGLSEDLAQEAFLVAWQKLAELRDRTKLGAWLCGIVRNIARDAMRRKTRDIGYRAAPLDEQRVATTDISERITQEERESVVWAAIEGIPEMYREPLILYYREGQSIRSVAEALDLTEDCVKQRLTRGRARLKDELAAFVEESLGRSGPGKSFTAGVVAALCAGSAKQAAAATVAVTAAKGASGALLGPLVGILGGVYGAWNDYRKAESARERRIVVIMASALFAHILGMLALLPATEWGARTTGLSRADWLGGWFGILFGGVGLIVGIGTSRIRNARGGTAPTLVADEWQTGSGRLASSALRTLLAVAGGLAALALFLAGWIAVEHGTVSSPAARSWVYAASIIGTLMAGAIAALWQSTNTVYRPEARRFMALWILGLTVLVALYLAALPFVALKGWLGNVITVAYAAGLMSLIVFGSKHVEKLRRAGQFHAGGPAEPPARLGRGAALGNTYGAFAGAMAWTVVLALMVQDWFMAAVLAAAIALVPWANLRLFAPRYWRIVLADMVAAAALSLAVLNLRWETWMALYRTGRFYEPGNDHPLWTMNVLVGGLFAVFIVVLALRDRNGAA